MITLRLYEVSRHDGMGGSTSVGKFEDANDAQAIADHFAKYVPRVVDAQLRCERHVHVG